MDRLEIYTSKKKSILLLIASIAFVALGIWLLSEADNMTGWRAGNPIFTRAIGIASILFFGFGIFVEIKIQSTRIVIIGVKNPVSCLEKETSSIRKKMMQFNINNYNSPFNIAASGLDISSNELN